MIRSLISITLLIINITVLFTLNCQSQVKVPDEWVTPDGCDKTQMTNPIWSPQTPVASLSTGWVMEPSFSDEFEANQLNEAKWYVEQTGCHPMSSEALFLKNNNTYSVDGHCLLLKQYKLLQPMTCPHSGKEYSFASAYITAHATVRYGYYEIRCKYPANINLNPCFWFNGAIGNPIVRYDEIDAMEYVDRAVSANRLRNSVVYGYDQPAPNAPLPVQLECKPILSTTSFLQDTLVIGVEWFPKEVNFYLNRECVARFKHSYDTNVHVRHFNFVNSDYTCVNFEEALPQLMILSYSVNKHNLATFDSIQDGMRWAIDWIRSYKLQDAKDGTVFWPKIITLADPVLTKVHDEIILGGDSLHSGEVPVSDNLTFWSKTNISLGNSFVVQPGSTITLRCIQTAPEVFQNDLQPEE